MQRRHFIASTSGMALLGCSKPPEMTGGFAGTHPERGHLLRSTAQWPAPSKVHRTQVVIAGGGVAGLAAARGLRLKGIDDFALLELEDEAGGNARGTQLGGMACPLGAHYLPVPDGSGGVVQDLLEELGLRQRVAGRWVYDERYLCHSPQERLFFNGTWQDGLLPVQGVGASTLAQYGQFAQLVEQARKAAPWPIPAQNTALAPMQRALAAITFEAYLNQQGLNDPHLRWYLDYCCRDDYGAGSATVSAWAGIHYFASRHGFHAPGFESTEREGVLTWPEGNAWLTRRLAAPLGGRLHSGWVVLRIASLRHGVEVDAFNTATQTVERWVAPRAIVALPVHVAARVVEGAPDFLRNAAQGLRSAPWLVANLQLSAPLFDRPGAAPSWDNVLYGAAGLGYVDAMHQSLQSVPGPTVLTYYRALGDVPQSRQLLLDTPWSQWRDTILAELAVAHPDIYTKVVRLDITRHGHAMAIPIPKNNGQIGHRPLWDVRKQLSNKERLQWQRLHFAHSDWAGYSVFEEAFEMGHGAA